MQKLIRGEDVVLSLVKEVLQNLTGNSALPNQARLSVPLSNVAFITNSCVP